MFDLQYISELLQALLLATLPVLAGFGARYLAAKYNLEKAKLTNEQQFMIDGAIKVAVFAAEQLGANDFIDDKKEYAMKIAEEYLDGVGIELDFYELEARIEAAVKEAFNKDAPAKAPLPLG